MKPPFVVYAELLPGMRRVAHSLGYALGIHGTIERDCDLIAAPWTDEASSAEVLIEALREEVNGFIVRDLPGDVWNGVHRNPVPKPHGRLAWAIRLSDPEGRLYFDVSVMPRVVTGHPGEPQDSPEHIAQSIVFNIPYADSHPNDPMYPDWNKVQDMIAEVIRRERGITT